MYPAFAAYVMSHVPASRRGAAFGAMIAAFDMGIGTGSSTLGWIIDAHGFRIAFGVAAIIAVLSAALLPPGRTPAGISRTPPACTDREAPCRFAMRTVTSSRRDSSGRSARTWASLPTRLQRNCRRRLGWTPPGDDESLGTQWTEELDRNLVARAMLIASVPGDEASVATAVRAHPSRFVGAFMFNPAAPGPRRQTRARVRQRAVHGVFVSGDAPVLARRAVRRGRLRGCGRSSTAWSSSTAVLLSVGARKKTRAPEPVRHPSRRSARRRRAGGPPSGGDGRHPALRRRLLPRGADGRGPRRTNIVFDTSSSNSWMRFLPRSHTARRLRARARHHRSRTSAVRQRLVVLSTRMARPRVRIAARDCDQPRAAGCRAGRHLWW